jgi:SAM-dependent methyltransferase
MNLVARFPSLLKKIVWNIDIPYRHTSSDSVHVDLGAGHNPRNPFGASKLIATEMHDSFTRFDGVEFVKADLTRQLPFESHSISSFSAYDVLEHIPRWERVNDQIRFPFIDLMSEIYRCLVPGGIFLSVTPAYPKVEAFQDPTHVNVISKETIRYFAAPEPWATLTGYGFVGSYQVISQTWLRGNGPFCEVSLLSNYKEQRFRTKVILVLRICRRTLNAALNRKPTHLLWVLQK